MGFAYLLIFRDLAGDSAQIKQHRGVELSVVKVLRKLVFLGLFGQKLLEICHNFFAVWDHLLLLNEVFNQEPFVFFKNGLVHRLENLERSQLHFQQHLVENGEVFELTKQVALLQV